MFLILNLFKFIKNLKKLEIALNKCYKRKLKKQLIQKNKILWTI